MPKPLKKEVKNKIERRSKLSNFGLGRERDVFIENFAMLVASGITINAALEAMQEEKISKRMKDIIGTIEVDINSGYSLSNALEKTALFSPNTLSLIRIGEESGQLAKNLKVIAEQQIKDRVFKAKIKSAMMYPLFVLGLAFFIGIGVAWFILPKLANVFDQLQLELPAITEALIALGKYLGEHGAIAIPITLVGCIAILYFIFFFPKTKVIGQTLLFLIPGIKKLIMQVELARFGYLLGILLKAGIPVPRAIGSVHEATNFPQYKKLYASFMDSINEGNSFKKTFSLYPKSKKLLTPPVQHLIIAAEQSGNLAETFLKISQNYEEKTEITSKNLSVILEPFLLVVVWIGVVLIALAVILPLYNLIGGL